MELSTTSSICGIDYATVFDGFGHLMMLFPQFALWATNMASALPTPETI